LYTVDTALDFLKKYDITEADLTAWEKALNLELPTDESGQKLYSPHHINLFKNIKKHLALGRTIDEISRIITLPPLVKSQPQATHTLPFQTEIRQAQARIEEPALVGASISTSAEEGKAVTRPENTSYSSTRDLSAQRESQPMNTQARQRVNTQKTSNQTSGAPLEASSATSAQQSVSDKSPYASTPKRANVRPPLNGQQPLSEGGANVVQLVQRLTQEKDQLYKKLLETEKLNSHLYSANSLFHKKANEMSRLINQLKEDRNENERFKLLDDKSRLHKQLLDAERLTQQKQEEVQERDRTIASLQQNIEQYKEKVDSLTAGFNPDKFCGDWIETANLQEITYDNFGINIESERVRLFRISQRPSRCYGSLAVINTLYQYESNALWKREETLTVNYAGQDTLEGELTAEYILDGVPVAKAIYRVTCRRK
jgi:DNA-binding transcriptional MerR regulator